MPAITSYTDVADVTTYATTNGFELWALSSTAEKTNAVFLANKWVLNLHHQPADSEGNIWLYDDEILIEACILQTLYLARNKDALRMQELTNIKTGDQLQEGRLSVNRNDFPLYDDLAYQMVIEVMADYELYVNRTGRG